MRDRQSKGQVLVWVAVLLLAALLCIGLAVDGGIGLAVRQEMQNAADAGALAGARELCQGNRAQAEAVATQYTLQNGAQEPVKVELCDSQGEAVGAANASLVRVQASSLAETTLLRLFSVESYPVRATASAGCTVSSSACGLWPIAFPKAVWDSTACGTSLYVWDDDKVSYDCEEWQCQVVGEHGGSRVIGPGNRGWLDMRNAFDPGYPGTCPKGGGASLIKALIEDDCAGRISLPACIPGETGVKASVDKHVDARAGDHVVIPLFDSVGCNGGDFHIVGFGCAEVVAYHKKLTIRVWDPHSGDWDVQKNTKAIEVKVSCDNCVARCSTLTGEIASPGGDVIAIGLTK